MVFGFLFLMYVQEVVTHSIYSKFLDEMSYYFLGRLCSVYSTYTVDTLLWLLGYSGGQKLRSRTILNEVYK